MQPLNAIKSPLVFEDATLDEHFRLIGEDKPVATFKLSALNALLGGVYPGQMVAVGATPGCGKTTLMVQVADELAEEGRPVIFVSAELPAYKIVSKSLARYCGGKVNLSAMSQATGEAGEALERAKGLYREMVAPNICIASPRNTAEIGQLVSACVHERGQVPVVFIDYLQLLATYDAEPFADERLAICACIKQLRDIANAYGVPMFVVSTIARTSYSVKKPNLSMFGGASAIEYGFDAALHLHADEDKQREVPVGCTPLILSALKNRYGSTGYVTLDFDAARATFRDGA